jgi:xylulokinase
VLEKLNIDKSLLAKVYESPEITGYVKGIGILEGVPVVAGAGDNAAAAVGSGTVRAGRAFTTIGTSGVVYAHTDEPIIDKAGRVHTFCCAVPNKWHVMGVTQGAGLSLKWFRTNFAPELSYKEIDKIADSVSIGADNLLYLPYLMGERTPHLDPNARGTFVGISAIHEKKHFLRAVMEGVSYSLRDCLEVLYEMNIPVGDMLAVGGGGTSAFWRKMLCDLYNLPTKTIVAGVVYSPKDDTMFYAEKGKGSYKRVNGVQTRLHVKKFEDNEGLAIFGIPYERSKIDKIFDKAKLIIRKGRIFIFGGFRNQVCISN